MSEDALEIVRMRNTFYRDGYRRVLGALLLMILVNIILAFALGYMITHRPEPRYFATSSDGRITPLYPLEAPVYGQDEVLQWAQRAAVAAFSFNFATYQQDFQNAANFFTPDGWSDFLAELKSEGTLDTVLAKKLVVHAVATGAPVVLDRGVLSGRYVWKVQMPLLITYESASETMQQPVTVVMLISRVPTLNDPKGIAISSFVASIRPLSEST